MFNLFLLDGEQEARLLGLVPQQINEVEALTKNILDDHAGQTVLVVHHSDTLPELIVALGASTKPIILLRALNM